MSETNGTPADRIAELEAENARLKASLAYKQKFIDEMLRCEEPPTAEELAASVPHGPWYAEMIDRLRRGDPHASDSIPAVLRNP
jgi:hypothetical protein